MCYLFEMPALCKNYVLSKYYLNNENFCLNDFSIACFYRRSIGQH